MIWELKEHEILNNNNRNYVGKIQLHIIVITGEIKRSDLMKRTTQIGYINRNNQKNLGTNGEMGTDHMQKFYSLQCLNCGLVYKGVCLYIQTNS